MNGVRYHGAMQSHPRVEAIFAADPTRLAMLTAADEYGSVLGAAEQLLADADALGVRGLQKLATVGSLRKLEALLSELRVANMFARLGFAVSVLADQEFGSGGTYTPDLLVAGNELEVLVEVLQGSYGHPDISGPIDRALKSSGLKFRVVDYLGESLSLPGINYRERREAEKTIEQLVQQLIQHLSQQDPSSAGSVTFGAHRFEYGPSPGDEGYAAGGVTAVHWMRDDEYATSMLDRIRKKTLRQQQLPAEHRTTPFIVAYDNREGELSSRAVLTALTGSRCALATSDTGERELWKLLNPVRHPPEVATALEGVWGELVRAWGFGRDADVRIGPYGELVEASWARTLSAVLVTHVHGWVQWFPNPFATPRLREPRLLDIGLPIRGLEPIHPAWRRYP